MIIKDRYFGEGKPLICVPLISSDEIGIEKECKMVLRSPADLVEWRVDYFLKNNSVENVYKVLKNIRRALKNIPVLITYRTAFEGGEEGYDKEKCISEALYREMIVKFAEFGPDMIDIEVARGSDCEIGKLISDVKGKNVVVVGSMHDFNKTPDTPVMESVFDRMNTLGADIFKIAVMPVCDKDVMRLMAFSLDAKEKYNNPIITISMGQKGIISRIAGEFDGSCITFASLKKASAPGQIGAKELAGIINKVSANKPNIYLVGFMGCGKTTISGFLGRRMKMPVIDTDAAIVESEGKSISEIFAESGEESFRTLETNILEKISKTGGSIISCGGGIVLREENIRIMKKYGSVIWLTAKPANILKRVSGDKNRPLLKDNMNIRHISNMLDSRKSMYERAADYVIRTDDRSIESIVKDILKQIP